MGSSGSLVCVGAGVTLASHLTPLARSYIEQADVVFAGLSDATVELWLGKVRPDLRSFQPIFRQPIDRADPYKRVVEAVLAEVRAGKTVCAVFYGHPGMFSSVCHHALEAARSEGHRTHLEPAISAGDCLYAELGIDPGKYGCQHYEVSQFMLHRRRLDTSAYLILWQAGVVDDPTLAWLRKKKAYRRLLVDVLARDYPLEHEVIIYKAPYVPVERPNVHRTTLELLPTLRVDPHGTLVLPPARQLESDPAVRERLVAIDKGGR
jgi:precorrin-6B methylase 1